MNIPQTTEFAFSFSHANLRVNGRQFTKITNVQANQEVQEAAVYGTARGPVGRSAGQLGMGSGRIAFSDYREGSDFIRFLGDDPLFKLWELDYSLVLESGTVRSIECRACRLLSIGVDHSNGPEALGVEYPFSFLAMKVDGQDVALTVGSLLKLGVQLTQTLLNQL